MQFTPEILRRHAQVLVDKEAKSNRDILAAYLRGSLLYGSPLLGGAGDIDLVFIHNSPPEVEREIRKLTPEINFDIEHHDQMLYRTPRELRLDPWLGPTLRDALPIHDPRHLLDYTQSGVRSNFDFPENIQARSQKLLRQSRQFWLDRQISPPGETVSELQEFLSALENALNAVALLTGPALTIRRLGKDFADRAQAVSAPGLAVAFDHLLGAVNLPQEKLEEWLGHWNQAMQTLGEESRPGTVLSAQKTYFFSALDDLIHSDTPTAGLWPLLNSWTEIIRLLPEKIQLQTAWIKAITALGFAGSDYQIRLAAFDSFLELCESLILIETDGTP